MIPFNLTALTRSTPQFNETQKPAKSSIRKPSKNLPKIHSYFQISIQSVASVQKYTLKPRRYNISKKAMTEMNSQFTIDEDQ